MTLIIRLDDLRGPEIAALLQEHLDDMHVHSPPEHVHALDLEGLRAPGISFWTAWDGSALAGCGALRALDAAQGEIKSMRTARDYLRKGVAAAILEHIIAEARSRAYRRLSLETGAMAAFAPAHRLYERYGFRSCPPFADYQENPLSRCMTLALDG
jgi:putative acetyltransferase